MNEETKIVGDNVVITTTREVPKEQYVAQKQRELAMIQQMQARQESDQAARIAQLQADIAKVEKAK